MGLENTQTHRFVEWMCPICGKGPLVIAVHWQEDRVEIVDQFEKMLTDITTHLIEHTSRK